MVIPNGSQPRPVSIPGQRVYNVSMKRVLILSAADFEDCELLYPFFRLAEESVKTTIASLKQGVFSGKHGYEAHAEAAAADIDPARFDALILPGGRAPLALRGDAAVQKIVRDFMQSNKPIAAICHGPQILISAGVMRAKKATCYKTVRDELIASGANYEDAEVVVDGNLVTSRMPADLPAFMREFLLLIKKTGR